MNDSGTHIMDDEIFLPEMEHKIIDQNTLHVSQSIQGLNYNSCLRYSEDYKTKKVRLPTSKCKKLAVFDMDETLVHCLPPLQLEIDIGLKNKVDVVLP